jgi:hypothetical protein
MSNNSQSIKSLMAKLDTAAGLDEKGNSRTAKALATVAARLYASLATHEDETLRDASYTAAVCKAKESLRVKRATRSARLEAQYEEQRILKGWKDSDNAAKKEREEQRIAKLVEDRAQALLAELTAPSAAPSTTVENPSTESLTVS